MRNQKRDRVFRREFYLKHLDEKELNSMTASEMTSYYIIKHGDNAKDALHHDLEMGRISVSIAMQADLLLEIGEEG